MRYFAYGSNISEERMSERGIDYTKREFCVLPGYKLVFNKKALRGNYSFANIVKSNGDYVEGYIYDVSESDLAKLDKFEGYPKHYNRVCLSIIDSIVYIASDDKIVEGLSPTKEYMNLILSGKFSDEYLKKLKEIKTYD